MVLSTDGHADLRALLLQAAREILDEPDTALDLRKVAERAGKSRTAPYLVFGKTEEGGGLDALKVAIAVEGFEAMTADVARVLARPADPESRLRLLARGYLHFAEMNPRLYRLMFGPEVSRAVTGALTDAPPRTEVHELLVVRARLEDLFRWVIEEAQDAGVLERGDSTRQVLGSWALLHGAAMLLLDGQLELAGVMSGDAVAELVLPFLMDEGAGSMEEPARLLAEARTRRGFPLEDSPGAATDHTSAAVRPEPDPALIAELREAAGDRIPGEVWDIVARPRGQTPPGLSGVRALVARSPALRRARRMKSVLQGSHLLWCGVTSRFDDPSSPIATEVDLLRSLGVTVTMTGKGDVSRRLDGGSEGGDTSGRGRGGPPDLAVLARTAGGVTPASPDTTPGAPADLQQLQSDLPGLPVILYLADPEPHAPRPAGSAGATHDPAELLHLVLDVLERVRV
jgi:AcrR family transcriptional regulator